MNDLAVHKPHADNDVLTALKASPPVAAFLALKAKKVAEQRNRLAAALKILEDESTAANRSALAKIEEARERQDAAKAALAEAGVALNALWGARLAESARVSGERQRLQQELRDTAHPAIDPFYEELRDELGRTRKQTAIVEGETTRNPHTGTRSSVYRTKGITPAQRMQHIRDTLAAVEALALVADQSTVPARIEELRNAIPQVGANA